MAAVSAVTSCWRSIVGDEDGGGGGGGFASRLGQERFLSEVLCHADVERHPPQLAYTKRVVKAFVRDVERSGGDAGLDDGLAEIAASLMGGYGSSLGGDGSDADSKFFYRAFQVGPAPAPPITLSVTEGWGGGLETGGNVWVGGLLMAHFLTQQAGLFSGQRVVEFGAGTGMGGIALAKTGQARSVTLTDVMAPVLDVLRVNVEANGLEVDAGDEEDQVARSREGAGNDAGGDTCKTAAAGAGAATAAATTGTSVAVQHLDLRDPWCGATREADAVIAADVTYDQELCTMLVRFMGAFLRGLEGEEEEHEDSRRRRRRQAFVACVARTEDVYGHFHKELAAADLRAVAWGEVVHAGASAKLFELEVIADGIADGEGARPVAADFEAGGQGQGKEKKDASRGELPARGFDTTLVCAQLDTLQGAIR